MSDAAEAIVRAAFEAFLAGDLEALRALVDPDLEWTYLDPTDPDPRPATCRGRAELEKASGTWRGLGLATELDELRAGGDRVLVILHAPGLDGFRARSAEDRNFHVATVSDGRVTALRACRDRDEALRVAGLA